MIKLYVKFEMKLGELGKSKIVLYIKIKEKIYENV